jgi:signal transduction histidine kinase
VDTESRYPPQVEVATYHVVSEALTNTTKHAGAAQAQVVVEERDDTLRVRVSDKGVGGAEPQRGSGLIGLRDRVEALGGAIDLTSPVGRGTVIHVSLPLDRNAGG